MAASSTMPKRAPSDVLRVLVATDNHLGFLSTDPIRGEDSFETMDEILQIGRDWGCDCAFMSGDLFHHNKPSRRTMFRAQQVFKKHVFGDGPVSIEVTSDQRSNFGGRIVNYEDPNLSVQLPIFMIHGNHDDPTREGPSEPLSALDILAEAGLVNYFGRADKADDIHIRPVLIEKGPVKVALYGLGWVRDERLNRTFSEKKVRFTKLEGDDQSQNWYNIMLIHQNRSQKGRGEKNSVAESMIPPFMDFVIWGHEHECEINPVEKGSFYLSQPGSSIAASLVEGEALPKYIGILEIRCEGKGFASRLIPIPLKTVRPFLLDPSIELSEEGSLKYDMPEAEKQDAVMQFLTDKVNKMLDDYTAKLRKEGRLAEDYEDEELDQVEREALRRRQIPLVRLKVEHTGFPTINLQRFGAQFTARVANPGEIVQFWKKKRITASGARKAGGVDNLDGLQDEEGAYDDDDDLNLESPQDRIQRIAEQVLKESDQNLEIFTDQKLHLAIEDFVVKETTTAIHDFVEETIDKIQSTLRKERVQGVKRFSDEKTIGEAVAQALDKERRKDELEKLKAGPRQDREELRRLAMPRTDGTKRVRSGEESEDVDDDDDESKKDIKNKQNKPPSKTISAKPPAKKVHISEPDTDDVDESEGEETSGPIKRATAPTARVPAASTAPTRPAAVPKKTAAAAVPVRVAKRRKVDSEDDDDDETSNLISQPKYPSASAGVAKVAAARKGRT